MRKDATFIAVEVDDALARDPQAAAKLAEVCPVDIYARTPDGTLDIIEDNLDECVLCRLCLHATDNGIRILKLYEDGAVLV